MAAVVLALKPKAQPDLLYDAGFRAEVRIKGFELDGEVIGQSMFDAAAEGPAGTRAGETLPAAGMKMGAAATFVMSPHARPPVMNSKV